MGGRIPKVVAQFNMDFERDENGNAKDGNQRSILLAKLRRDPGPNFETGHTDCVWELESQRHLMDAKKFDQSVFNNIATKCFFFRGHDANERRKKAGGWGGAVASATAAV